jgi:hypothetical protein
VTGREKPREISCALNHAPAPVKSPGVNPCYSLLAVLLLGACAGPRQALAVKQFQLRDVEPKGSDQPMARMEKERHLYGAVSWAEQRNRLGQYYTLLWNDPDGAGQGDVELIFQYQQGGSASLVKQMTKSFPSSATKGLAEFAVIGDDYFKGGKVLTWKATLRRGKREIASRQSYLWR